ncbi:MAG: hypothetical protein RIS35_1973 [Pseudomonadota bacterium]|jgi:hypothetical protein
MHFSRFARRWASLLTLIALLVTTGAPMAGARPGEQFLGEICSVAAVADGEGGTRRGDHPDRALSPHCGACPGGLAALLDPFPQLRTFASAVAHATPQRLVEARGHGGPRPRSDAPPRAPPPDSVA